MLPGNGPALAFAFAETGVAGIAWAGTAWEPEALEEVAAGTMAMGSVSVGAMAWLASGPAVSDVLTDELLFRRLRLAGIL